MRMWMIPASLLCRKHLLGEHNECHMIAGSIKKGISLQGYFNKNLVEPQNVKERHDELAEEMKRRGYNHKSPLDQPDFTKYGRHFVNKEENIKTLIDRCTECRKRIEGRRQVD